MKLKKVIGNLIGEIQDYIIGFEIVKIGLSHVNVHGVYRLLCFMVKMTRQSCLKKYLITYQIYFLSMDLIYGLSGVRMNCYLKSSVQNIVQTVFLQKKLILWMYGSTQVLHMKLY